MAVRPEDDTRITFTDLEIGKVIGRGGGGIVYQGKCKSKPVAIKELHGGVDEERLQYEIERFSKLHHTNIISFYGAVTERNRVYVVTELAENGSLRDYLKSHPDPDLPQSLHWAMDIAKGVRYLHENSIIHRDLKSANVLLTADLTAKVCDFGIAKQTTNTTTKLTAVQGTCAWMPPEAFRGISGKQSDSYSYGILLWELSTRKIPFSTEDGFLLPGKIMSGERPPIPDNCDPRLSRLMQQCWNEDRNSRPTFDRIVSILCQVSDCIHVPHLHISYMCHVYTYYLPGVDNTVLSTYKNLPFSPGHFSSNIACCSLE